MTIPNPVPFLLALMNYSQLSRGILLYIPVPVLLLTGMFSLQPQSLRPLAWWMSAHLALLSSSFTSPLKPCQSSPGRADKIFLEPLLYPIHDSIISSVTSLFPPPGPLWGHECVLTRLVSIVLISTMSGTEKMLKNICWVNELIIDLLKPYDMMPYKMWRKNWYNNFWRLIEICGYDSKENTYLPLK